MPKFIVPESQRHFARTRRKTMTALEARLWNELRGKRFSQYKFRRQFPVRPYIAESSPNRTLRPIA